MGRVFLGRSAGGRLVAVKVIKDELAIATASVEHTVSLWDAANGRELVRWPHDSPVTAVTFSPDSTRLITGSADRTIRLWDLASGAQISRVEHDEIRVFSPDRTQLATGRRSVVRLLDLVTPRRTGADSAGQCEPEHGVQSRWRPADHQGRQHGRAVGYLNDPMAVN